MSASTYTFSQKTKADLCQLDYPTREQQEAALALAAMSVATFRGRQMAWLLSFEPYQEVINKLFYRLFGFRPQATPVGHKVRLSLPRGPEYETFVAWLSTYAQFNPVMGSTTLSAEAFTLEQRRAALRASFLAFGSVGNPDDSYHLELGFRRKSVAQLGCDLLAQEGFETQGVARSGSYRIYLKDAQEIAHFLGLIGAHSALLQIEALRIEKEVRNAVNRAVNCDSANLKRVVATASRQIQGLKALQAAGRLNQLPPALQEMAQVRLAHPELSIQELGEWLDPPLGKSGVNHRLKRLEEAVQQFYLENGLTPPSANEPAKPASRKRRARKPRMSRHQKGS